MSSPLPTSRCGACCARRRQPPRQDCDPLIEATLEHGATDDVTVIVVTVIVARRHATEPTMPVLRYGVQPMKTF